MQVFRSFHTAERTLEGIEALHMMRKGAPRYAVLNRWYSQQEFGGTLLGHPIYLEAKAEGDKSMSEKRKSLEDAYGVVLQGPHDMAKARLPESQSPVVQHHAHRHGV